MLIRIGHDDRDRAREAFAVHWRGHDHAEGGSPYGRRVARDLDASLAELTGARHFNPPEALAAAITGVLSK